MLTRRQLLATSAAMALAAALPKQSEAAAAAVIAAAIAVASAVTEMMKKSGDVEAEWQAVNLKLDRIIGGIEQLQSSMLHLARMIDELSVSVQGIPSDVISLQLVIEARQRIRQTGESISIVSSRPFDPAAKTFLSDSIRSLYTTAGLLFAAVEETNRPPALVIAAIDLLNATKLIQRATASAGQVSDLDLQLIKTAATRALDSLRVMAGPDGVAKRLAEIRTKIDTSKAQVSQLPLASVLPKDWGQPGPAAQPTAPDFCVRGPTVRSNLEHHSGTEILGDPPHLFRRRWWNGKSRDTVVATHIPFAVSPVQTLSGRAIYSIESSSPDRWGKAAWTRDVAYSEEQSEYETRRDPDAILAGCAALAVRADGLPAETDAFMANLATYNALTAVESLLVGLQARAERSIASA